MAARSHVDPLPWSRFCPGWLPPKWIVFPQVLREQHGTYRNGREMETTKICGPWTFLTHTQLVASTFKGFFLVSSRLFRRGEQPYTKPWLPFEGLKPEPTGLSMISTSRRARVASNSAPLFFCELGRLEPPKLPFGFSSIWSFDP